MRDHDPLSPDDEIEEQTIDLDEYVENGEHIEVPLSTGGLLIVNKTEPFSFFLSIK